MTSTVFGVDDGRVVRRRWVELATEEPGDLARETDHRQQVDAIHGRRDVEHLVADRQDVDERRPGRETVGEHHDPGVVVSEADLVLGQDHPARRLTAELALVQRLVEDREERTRERDRNGRTGLEVPRAADDLARVSLPHVDLADAEPIGVRMLSTSRTRPTRKRPMLPSTSGTPTSSTRSTSSDEIASRCAISSAVASTVTYSRSQESGARI